MAKRFQGRTDLLGDNLNRRSSPQPLPVLDLAQLNPGVRELVRRLRAQGWDTCDSGDGKTHEHACDRPDPYVVIRIKDPDVLANVADRMIELMERWGVKLEPIGTGPCIQASYDPVDGRAFIDLMNVTDEMLGPDK